MSILLDFLTKNKYKPLENNKFREKVKEYFGISEFDDRKDVVYFSHPKGYDIDLKHQFINIYETELYFLVEMGTLDKGIQDLVNNRFVCYNKIIFNDDISSITQILNDLKAVEDLVIYFDYEKNPMLVSIALNNLDTHNIETIYLEHIIFFNDRSKKDFIKRNFLFKILEKDEVFFTRIIQTITEFWNDFSVNDSYKYNALAYMLNILLKKYHKDEYNIHNVAYIVLNNAYIEKDMILLEFIKNDYYAYELLKEYSQFYIIMQYEQKILIRCMISREDQKLYTSQNM